MNKILKPSIEEIFNRYNKNTDMLAYVSANPSLFIDLIDASLDTVQQLLLRQHAVVSSVAAAASATAAGLYST